jgi:hypothetical protein
MWHSIVSPRTTGPTQIRVLLRPAVDLQPDVALREVAGPGGEVQRADRRGAVEALAGLPGLLRVAHRALQVAARHVRAERMGVDAVERDRLAGEVATELAVGEGGEAAGHPAMMPEPARRARDIDQARRDRARRAARGATRQPVGRGASRRVGHRGGSRGRRESASCDGSGPVLRRPTSGLQRLRREEGGAGAAPPFADARAALTAVVGSGSAVL